MQQALADAAFNGSSIQSAVNAGVVKLYGNVRTNEEKTLAEAMITNLRGVKSITDLLTVIDRTPAPVAASAPIPVAPNTVTVPQGTTIPVRLTGEIDTKTAAAGDSFTGTTAANVSNAGAVVIPTGTPVIGRVIEAKAAGRLSGAALLSNELVSLKLAAPGGPTAGLIYSYETAFQQKSGQRQRKYFRISLFPSPRYRQSETRNSSFFL